MVKSLVVVLSPDIESRGMVFVMPRLDSTVSTYHSLLSETADLLDSLGGPLLEACAMDLCTPSISLMFTFSLPPDACRAKDEHAGQYHW